MIALTVIARLVPVTLLAGNRSRGRSRRSRSRVLWGICAGQRITPIFSRSNSQTDHGEHGPITPKTKPQVRRSRHRSRRSRAQTVCRRPSPLKGGGRGSTLRTPGNVIGPFLEKLRNTHRVIIGGSGTMSAMPRPAIDPMDLPEDGINRSRQCKAHSRSGKPCTRLTESEWYTICHYHGAKAPQVRRAASRRLADAEGAATLRGIMARFFDTDAEPVTDPAGALTRLAGHLESARQEAFARANEAVEAGQEPSESDLAAIKLLTRESRQVLTDMTRLQVGVAMYGHQAAQNGAVAAQNGDLTASEDQLALGGAPADLPSLAAIVESVIASESAAETDRLVRLKAVEQQALPGYLAVVDDGAGGSIAV